MSPNLLYNSCPSCKKHLPINLFSISGKIYRCPQCNALVADDPKRNWVGFFLILLGIVGSLVGRRYHWSALILDLLMITLSFTIWLFFKRLMIVKRDLVIKNRETNEICYIDQSDWEEILANSAGKENPFEITEYLKNR